METVKTTRKETSKNSGKRVSVSVLEARLARAVRPKDQLWATIRLAEGLLGTGVAQTERAFALFTESAQLAEDIHDRRGVAAAIRGLGSYQLHRSNLPAALELLEQALPIAEQTGYAECEMMVLRDMGNVHLRQNRQDLALKALQKCAELAERIGNQRVQAATLDQMGSLLYNLGQFQEALDCYTKSLALLERTGTPRDQAITLRSMSKDFRSLGKYVEALSALERSSQLSHAGQDGANEALCQSDIGLIYFEIGDYPKALSYFFTSIKILERIVASVGVKANLANAYGNVMEVYLRSGNTEQATDFGEKALAIFEEVGDKYRQAGMFGELGEYYLEQGLHTRALQMLSRSLELSREIGSKYHETMALTALARLDVTLGNYAASEKLFQEALAITSETGDPDRAVVALLGLGALFNKWGQLDRALPFLERAITVAEEIHSRDYEQQAQQMLAETLETREAEGDLQRALVHWKFASSIKEEILGLEKLKAVTELQIRSNIEKSENEKALLRKETEFKSHEIERMVMNLAEKTELIRSIDHRIKDIIKPWSPVERALFDKLLTDLEHDHSADGKQAMFNNEFQLVHREILQKLSKHHSTLTFTERKVCVLMKGGLSTKQMAVMLKVSTRAIEKHRLGIRKKMKLKPGVEIMTILERI